MNYDLAKELKDAGFPQGGEDRRGGIVHAPGCDWKTVPCAQPYTPLLEELIDACGDDFVRLVQQEQDIWRAEGFEDHINRAYTPTEAVARLWLALNKKPA